MTSTVFSAPSTGAERRGPAPQVRVLPCGLTVVAESMPVEAVNLNIWFRVGSALEPEPLNGVAHFLEHMVFKGSEALALGEFERRTEACGAKINAATSQDYTHFYLTASPQQFADLAPLQLEVVARPAIAASAFEREKQVVLEEIRRSGDNAQRRIFQRSMELAFEELPYRRSVLGPTATVAAMEPEQMREFHGAYYRPEWATAVVVGNLPTEVLFEQVRRGAEQVWGGDRPVPPVPPLPHFEPEPPFTEIERRTVIDPTVQQARLALMWRVPGAIDQGQTHPLDAIAAILGQGRLSRLVRDLREERRLVSRISATHSSYRYQGIFSIGAQLPIDQVETVEAAIIEHLERLHREPVTALELERIVRRVASGFIFSNETPSSRAGLYGFYQTMVGRLDVALDYPNLIRRLDPEQLQGAVRRFLPTDAYRALVVRPAA